MFCKINSTTDGLVNFKENQIPEDIGFIHLGGIPKERCKILCFGWGKLIRSLIWNGVVRDLNQHGTYNGAIIVVGRSIDEAYSLINNDGRTTISILHPDKANEEITVDQVVGAVGSTAFSIEDTPHQDTGKAALMRYATYDLDLIAVGITDKGFTDDSATLINLKEFLFHYYKYNKERTLTIINTDNVDHNGDEIKRIVKLHSHGDKQFEAWLDSNVDFKNSMVDHIVPDNGIGNNFGAEPYKYARLYLTEGQCRVPFNKVKGIKIRLLSKEEYNLQIKLKLLIVNAIHTSMIPIAALSGFRYTYEAIRDKNISEYLNIIFEEDIVKAINSFAPEHLAEARAIFREWLVRLTNPKILHDLHWIGQNTFHKTIARLIPTLKANKGEISSQLAFNLASQLRFLTPSKEDRRLKQLVGYIDSGVKKIPRKFAKDHDDWLYVFASGLYQFAEKKDVATYSRLLYECYKDHTKIEHNLNQIFEKWGIGGLEYERARKKIMKAYQQLLENKIKDVLARLF